MTALAAAGRDSRSVSSGAAKISFAGPFFTPYGRSFIDECAAALRADGFEVFVPHEHELATGLEVTAAWIFGKDDRRRRLRRGLDASGA